MNPDELLTIAMKLDTPSLLNLCQTNKRINQIIYKRDPIWFYRLKQDFPDWKEIVVPFKETPFTDSKSIDIYKYLYKLKKGKDMLKVGGTLLDYSKRTQLDLSDNSIKEIPETLPQNLQILYLSNNSIKEIPETLPQNLQELYLSNNSIKEIPETLPQNLQVLYLSDNSITEIPETLPQTLQILALKNNSISEIPETLPQTLQVLSLYNNFIKEIPETLPQNLQYLFLSHNPLTKKVVIPGVTVFQ
jgi:uncharacterized protein YaaW (UPF0174 family)